MNWLLTENQQLLGLPPFVVIIFVIMLLTFSGGRQRQEEFEVSYCRNIYSGEVRLTHVCNRNGDRVHYPMP